MGQLTEHDHMQLALATAAEIEAIPGMAKTAGPGGFRNRLADVLTWLRQQNINWPAIFAKLPQIIAALSAGDWATVITTILSLFNLPTNTPPLA